MKQVIWRLAVLGVISSSIVSIAEAQSLPSGTGVGILVVAEGEVRCLTCGELNFEGGGASHFFAGGGEHLVQRKEAGVNKSAVVLAFASRASDALGDYAGRACGGVSTCHVEWLDGQCHVECSGGGGQLAEQVESAVRSVNILRLQQAIVEGKGQARLNIARSAIQIIGCNDTVEYHIPLSTVMVAQLGAWIESVVRAE